MTDENGDPGAALGALIEQGRSTALERVAELESAALALIEGRLDATGVDEARRTAHKLAGSAGTFGFPEASRIAADLERVLTTSEPLPPERRRRAAELVEELNTALERPAREMTAAPQQATEGPARPHLLVLGARTHATVIADAARDAGFEAHVSNSAGEARAHRFPAGPSAVAIDLDVAHSDEVLQLVSDLRSSTPDLVVLGLTRRDAFTDRAAAADAGVTAFCASDRATEEILRVVRQLLERQGGRRARLVAVDDDPSVLAVLRGILSHTAWDLETCADPDRAWHVIRAVQPDLVLLDVNMPAIDGIELCEALRADEATAVTPVLFLTATADADTIRRMFEAGADDYVQKPVTGPELVARIGARLERSRLLEEATHRDPVTGLKDRHHAFALAGSMLRSSAARDEPISVVCVLVDRLAQANDTLGHGVGDAVLERVGALLQALTEHGHGISWRTGGAELGALLLGHRRSDAVQRVASALEQLRGTTFGDQSEFSASFSAGVAEYPEDGAQLDALARLARRAAHLAREEGGDRVRPSAVSAAPTATTDVVIVEDDPTLAELLHHALTTRGYETVLLDDGRAAADALAGPLRTRVLLLDVDLPGMNGLDLLRHLSSAGTLADTRVIMLTARSSDSEVIQALELGAFDHVAKPFSIPVLVQRVRRALETTG